MFVEQMCLTLLRSPVYLKKCVVVMVADVINGKIPIGTVSLLGMPKQRCTNLAT